MYESRCTFFIAIHRAIFYEGYIQQWKKIKTAPTAAPMRGHTGRARMNRSHLINSLSNAGLVEHIWEGRGMLGGGN